LYLVLRKVSRYLESMAVTIGQKPQFFIEDDSTERLQAFNSIDLRAQSITATSTWVESVVQKMSFLSST
jgi:hypothetical protein